MLLVFGTAAPAADNVLVLTEGDRPDCGEKQRVERAMALVYEHMKLKETPLVVIHKVSKETFLRTGGKKSRIWFHRDMGPGGKPQYYEIWTYTPITTDLAASAALAIAQHHSGILLLPEAEMALGISVAAALEATVDVKSLKEGCR